jgi:hypothetical protein
MAPQVLRAILAPPAILGLLLQRLAKLFRVDLGGMEVTGGVGGPLLVTEEMVVAAARLTRLSREETGEREISQEVLGVLRLLIDLLRAVAVAVRLARELMYLLRAALMQLIPQRVVAVVEAPAGTGHLLDVTAVEILTVLREIAAGVVVEAGGLAQ